MKNFYNNQTKISSEYLGALVKDGVPFSAIGSTELKILSSQLLSMFTVRIDKEPASLSGLNSIQYASGDHSSTDRKILGSIVIKIKSYNGNDFGLF